MFLANEIRTLVVIPTIDEKQNLELLLPVILSLAYNLDIFIVDDGSRDGTLELLQWHSGNNVRISYVSRNSRLGIGAAHVVGLRKAINENYDFCITMDGDQSHHPAYIPAILDELDAGASDLVLTSRFLRNGGLEGWNLSRKTLTFMGHLLTGIFAGTTKDLTSGMRGYKVSSISPEALDWLNGTHYEFFPLIYYFYRKRGLKISQIPIVLPKRAFGHSKLTLKLLFRNVAMVILIRINYCQYFDKKDKV